MDYYSDAQYGQNDSYGPPMNRQKPDRIPQDEVVEIQEKVTIPVDKYPGYNFVGSLLGPQGSILKGLTKSLRSKIAILGKGSMKDKKKEEELINSDDAEHAHLKEPLHVLISVKAPRAEAHSRMSAALIEIYKFMVPPRDSNQQQYNEAPYDAYSGGYDNGGGYGGGEETRGPRRGGPPRGRGGPPRGAARGRGGGGWGAPRVGYVPY